MKTSKEKYKITIYLSSIILIIILGLFSFFEFRWFNNIAKKEFAKTYSSLFLNTQRVVNREFERISMYANWLLKINSEHNEDTELDNNLTTVYNDSSKTILDKSVIDSLGYINTSTMEKKLYDGNIWETRNLENELLNVLDIEDDIIYFNDNQTLTLYIKISSNKFLEVNINLINFTNYYLLPSIEENNFDIVIKSNSQTDNQKINKLNYEKYSNLQFREFSPLKNIFHNSNKEYILFIPILMQDLDFEYEKNDLDINNKPTPVFDIKNQTWEKLFNIEESNIYSYLTVSVSHNNYSGFYIEETLSYIFIGGLFLISLIGFICILLIYQIFRIKRQNNKEREFTASITHELRTPLTVIQAASDNLNSNLISKERIPTYGKLIKQQTERLNNMIENLLVFSKIENNKAYKLNPSNINLANMIEQIESQFKSIASEKNIQIKWTKINLNKNLLLDKTIYELILSNLINNSIFHAYNGQKGEVRVTIHYSDQKKSINTIIEDDGRGIPVKEQKYIWKSYYRGKKSINEQERGSGLGLFIVNRNISILGGKINLSSPYKRLNGKINNGCKFEFYIPCKEIK